jgi:hypothetical protein
MYSLKYEEAPFDSGASFIIIRPPAAMSFVSISEDLLFAERSHGAYFAKGLYVQIFQIA